MQSAERRFDPESLRSASSQPCTLVRSSRALDWTDLLLDIQRGSGDSGRFETHRTGDVSLVVKMSGNSFVSVLKDGRWERAYYESGSAGLTSQHQSHRLRFEVQRGDLFAETAHLYLSSTLLEEVAEDYRRIGAGEFAREMNALVFSDATVFQTVLALNRGLAAGVPNLYAEQAASFLVTHLLSRHAGWWDAASDGRASNQLKDKRLKRAIEFMSASLASSLTLQEIAAEAGMSKHHFLREFSSVVGLTPFRYLQKVRLELASRLLRTSDLPVGEVGVQCGYPRASQFSTVFTRYYGLNPATYRAAEQLDKQAPKGYAEAGRDRLR